MLFGSYWYDRFTYIWISKKFSYWFIKQWFVFTPTTRLSLSTRKGRTRNVLLTQFVPEQHLFHSDLIFLFARGEGQEWEWVGGLFDESKSAFVRSLRWRWWGGTLWYHPSLARPGCNLLIHTLVSRDWQPATPDSEGWWAGPRCEWSASSPGWASPLASGAAGCIAGIGRPDAEDLAR